MFDFAEARKRLQDGLEGAKKDAKREAAFSRGSILVLAALTAAGIAAGLGVWPW